MLLLKILLICGCFLNIAQGSHFSDAEQNIRSTKAEQILRYMNESAEPCNDFYNFACGNWQVNNKANAAELHKSVLLNVDKDFEQRLREILENRNVQDSSIEKKAKDFYQSCLSRQPETDIYREQLQEIVQEFGSMPALEGTDKWQAISFDWLKTVAEINQKYGIDIILGYSIIPNPEDISLSILLLGHPEFPLPLALYSGNFQEEDYWRKYRSEVATRLARYFGFEAQLAEQTANEILDFEAHLAQGAIKDRYGPHEFPIKTTAWKLQHKYTHHLDIKRYLQMTLGSIPEDAVLERNEGYQYNLIEMLRITPRKTVANYIFYNLVHHFAEPVANSCVKETRRHFLKLVENMWYRQNNVSETVWAVGSLFEDLKAVFHTALLSSWYKWMGPRVRRYSVEKLEALELEVYSYDRTNFTEEYGRLILDNSDYIENLKSIYFLKGLKKKAMLYEAPQPYYDAENIPLAPKYIRNENRLIVPLAVLQPHYFLSRLFPNAINLGQLGTLLAHGILHAFDDEARFVDKYGNNADWWDHRSSVFFNDHNQCFIEQYRNYSYGGKPWPESAVQSENIADNGGIRLAYTTYRQWYEDTLRPQTNLDQEQLPDLNYKNRRLFFITYAQTMCVQTHPDYQPYILAKEYDTPENLRVVGALSNLEEFSNVFKCHQGSVMNPAHKCRVH